MQISVPKVWSTVDTSESFAKVPVWRTEVDALGRTYHWNIVTRVSQWDPPPPPPSDLRRPLKLMDDEQETTSRPAATLPSHPPFAYAPVHELRSHPLFCSVAMQ